MFLLFLADFVDLFEFLAESPLPMRDLRVPPNPCSPPSEEFAMVELIPSDSGPSLSILSGRASFLPSCVIWFSYGIWFCDRSGSCSRFVVGVGGFEAKVPFCRFIQLDKQTLNVLLPVLRPLLTPVLLLPACPRSKFRGSVCGETYPSPPPWLVPSLFFWNGGPPLLIGSDWLIPQTVSVGCPPKELMSLRKPLVRVACGCTSALSVSIRGA